MMRLLRVAGVTGMVLWGVSAWAPHISGREQAGAAPAGDGPVYVAYYWRAKPGRADEYNAYIKGTAEKIDEDARKAGAFIEVRTLLATTPADGPAPDWTHLRIFTLPNMDAVAKLGPALDAAGTRVVPDDAQRKANSARSAELRDAVRREVWTTLR
jgi:hypothetical protein